MNNSNEISLCTTIKQVPDLGPCINSPATNPTYLAMDVGSTTQRISIFDLGLETQSDILEMPTAWFNITDKSVLENCPSASKSLIDNLEMIITCLTSGKETLIKDCHVVKGSLMQRLNKGERELTSDTAKVDAVSTYVNIICNSAITLLLSRLHALEQLDREATIDLTVSLPPDDANLKARTDLFKQRLAGVYQVDFPRIKARIVLRFDYKNIITGSEPLGAALNQIMQDDFDETQTCIFLDCGGRSSGAVAYKDGLLMEATAHAFSVGGLNLLNGVADKLTEQYTMQRPRIDAVLRALDTGVVKQGGKPFSVISALNKAKIEMAEVIYTGLSTAISMNRLNAVDIEHVYCTGRTFGTTSYEGEKSPSICDHLVSLYAEKSPNTQFIRVTDGCAVVKGLIYLRLRAQAE